MINLEVENKETYGIESEQESDFEIKTSPIVFTVDAGDTLYEFFLLRDIPLAKAKELIGNILHHFKIVSKIKVSTADVRIVPQHITNLPRAKNEHPPRLTNAPTVRERIHAIKHYLPEIFEWEDYKAHFMKQGDYDEHVLRASFHYIVKRMAYTTHEIEHSSHGMWKLKHKEQTPEMTEDKRLKKLEDERKLVLEG